MKGSLLYGKVGYLEWGTNGQGLKASLVLCSNPAITYGMFERMKSLLLEKRPREGNVLSAMEVFLLGAISKSMATITTYDVNFFWRD
jgi:hypothetical protein